MSFDQERTGKDEPDAARDDTPTAPPVLSLEKTAPPAEPEPESGAATEPVADVEPEPVADAAPAPAVSFAKRDIPGGEDAAEGAAAAVPPPTAPAPTTVEPAVAAPAPANPWAAPAGSAPSEAPPAAPAPAAVPAASAPAAPVNPWAAPAPGAAPAAPGAPAAPANPWAPTGVRQPWGSGALPPGQVPGQVSGQFPVQVGMPGYPVYPGYPQPPRSPATNGLAIAALVVSFLCYLGILGIGLGIAALVQIKRTGERGRGMAVSAVVIGTVWLVLLVLAVTTGAFSAGYEDDARPRGRATHDTGGTGLSPLSPLNLNIGDCANLAVRTATKKPDCSAPHNAEVFWAGVSTAKGGYPGERALKDEADDLCSHHLDEYVMDTWSIPEATEYPFAFPDADSWNAVGGRRIVCFLKSDKPSTGSLRKDRSNLTSDQVQFLEATDQFDRLWIDEPDEDLDVADDPEAFRTWAGKLAAGADRQAAMLEAAHWTGVDKSTVTRLVQETRVAARHFRAAAAAADSGTVEDEISAAHEHLGDAYVLDLRRALKLATQDEEPVKHPSDQLV
ncbi:hypothetical protein Kpho02_16850 [Kitasatospora phosalacinea]|uniref:DUF4190 domain-containing protein n=1 Tax=Kitasatospora phosalacinea TaxID=2065 RepID=A0A9W6Q5Y4_9ACTN|nr:DUF4190 domain-containing protein [Kitasatospora phosalacinea]GLW69386.1 hypothetical protein Kpho02_16850 [Kitasatospora phosalacinea]